MSLAGFKKQLNKANQYMSEKIGGAKGTELDDDFMEMERKTDVLAKCVVDLQDRTHEFLQPNPASRAKLTSMNALSKMRGQAKTTLYPQPEGVLGESMIKHGKDLGEESQFGHCLQETGESCKQLADIKYALEDNVKQNFLEPLQHLSTKDIKEVNHHRKKLSGRRLDYDCKKRKQTKGSTVTEEEIRMAEEKFDESKTLAESAMHNLLENDVEQISQLASFVESLLNYHRQAADILTTLNDTLQESCNEAASRPRTQHIIRTVISSKEPSPVSEHSSNNFEMDHSGYSLSPAPQNFGNSTSNNYNNSRFAENLYATVNKSPRNSPRSSPRPSPIMQRKAPNQTPCCEALYDFEPENEGELGFKEADIITLISRIDENWYEGSINGRNGYFPTNYVKVIVDVQ